MPLVVDQLSGPFGQGGQDRKAVTYLFEGRLGAPFTAFAVDRAKRLNLGGHIVPGETSATIYVEGPDAMIGAFETACSLGPIEADVQRWAILPTPRRLGVADFSISNDGG
ncbi:MAG: hypothetical protein AAFW76_12730 [Pseudomonadota bacterium]